MTLFTDILAHEAELREIRRDIHAHPELCFQEQRTADVIARRLTEWGIPIHRGLGGTGVVGIIRGGDSPRASSSNSVNAWREILVQPRAEARMAKRRRASMIETLPLHSAASDSRAARRGIWWKR